MKIERCGIAAMAVMALLSACGGGGDGTPSTAAPSARALASLEAPGAQCPAGGARIESGIDGNGNGALDVAEVVSTQYVCDGAAGVAGASGRTTLVRLFAEAAGSHCANGGTRVDAGADTDADGVLSAGETTSVAHVCAGATGATGSIGSAGADGRDTLMTVVAESAGTHCAAGGSLVTSGPDTNRNGSLDLSEVASTVYVCNGVAGTNGTNGSNGTNGTNGLNLLTLSVTEAPGAHRAAGGFKLTSGADTSRDGVLDIGEVTATSYVCHGQTAIGWVNVTATSAQALPNTGYVANNAAQVTVTLPASPAVGDIVRVSGAGAGGWAIAQNAGQTVVVSNLDLVKKWTAAPIAPRAWRGVASSADGNRLVAVAANGVPIQKSANGGLTWTSVETGRSWVGVASSAEGRRLIAAAYNDQIYVSDDYGGTWAPTGSGEAWQAVASSYDGRVLAAVGRYTQVHVSEDYGSTWSARGTSRNWQSVAVSADGSRIIAAEYAGPIDISDDTGASWTSRATFQPWMGVATSADGRKLVAVADGQPIYTSDDFGVTWTPRDSARKRSAVASSADGSRLVATLLDDTWLSSTLFVYTSTDQGLTWTANSPSNAWFAVASSADGSRIVAVAEDYNGNGEMWLSAPPSATTTTVGTAGRLIGKQYQAIELQYLGAGRFVVLDAFGSGFDVE